ncbi:hypothetical protein QBC44DRAFT_372239 [Cladorrhinum sp. PSN332]|nr:hypothetical protein QBC44DRAFT_372239 [Cladorrhinum sp. PSN332]
MTKSRRSSKHGCQPIGAPHLADITDDSRISQAADDARINANDADTPAVDTEIPAVDTEIPAVDMDASTSGAAAGMMAIDSGLAFHSPTDIRNLVNDALSTANITTAIANQTRRLATMEIQLATVKGRVEVLDFSCEGRRRITAGNIDSHRHEVKTQMKDFEKRLRSLSLKDGSQVQAFTSNSAAKCHSNDEVMGRLDCQGSMVAQHAERLNALEISDNKQYDALTAHKNELKAVKQELKAMNGELKAMHEELKAFKEEWNAFNSGGQTAPILNTRGWARASTDVPPATSRYDPYSPGVERSYAVDYVGQDDFGRPVYVRCRASPERVRYVRREDINDYHGDQYYKRPRQG